MIQAMKEKSTANYFLKTAFIQPPKYQETRRSFNLLQAIADRLVAFMIFDFIYLGWHCEGNIIVRLNDIVNLSKNPLISLYSFVH